MAIKLNLFRKSKELADKIDKFFDKLSESSVIYRLAVRSYLREGINEDFRNKFKQVSILEHEADILRRDIENHLYSNTLIPDSRGDVLGLIETLGHIYSLFRNSLESFCLEKPLIDTCFSNGFRRLTNMVVKSVDELTLAGRDFFKSPHGVIAHNNKVILYEKEADKITYNLKKQIFDSDLELAFKVHLREFVENIDSIADQAEDVADRLTIYAIKRMN